MSVTQAVATYGSQQPVSDIYIRMLVNLGSFRSKAQSYTNTTHVLPSVSPFLLFVEFSWTYLYQSCPASSSFMQIGCCHTLLKDVNDFPTSTIHISWQILVKFGTRELKTITLSSCQFPENRSVKDTFHVVGWTKLHHSFYISHLISTINRHKSCPKNFSSDCVHRENRRSEIHKGKAVPL